MLLFLFLCIPVALAGDERERRGGNEGASATSKAIGIGKGGAGGLGGAGGQGGQGGVGGTGGVATATSTGAAGNINNTSKSYAIGMSDLVTSQGDCPLLGSVSILFIAGTYEIERCTAWRDIELMRSVGMIDATHQEIGWLRACQVPSIAEINPWCNGKVIQR